MSAVSSALNDTYGEGHVPPLCMFLKDLEDSWTLFMCCLGIEHPFIGLVWTVCICSLHGLAFVNTPACDPLTEASGQYIHRYRESLPPTFGEPNWKRLLRKLFLHHAMTFCALLPQTDSANTTRLRLCLLKIMETLEHVPLSLTLLIQVH